MKALDGLAYFSPYPMLINANHLLHMLIKIVYANSIIYVLNKSCHFYKIYRVLIKSFYHLCLILIFFISFSYATGFNGPNLGSIGTPYALFFFESKCSLQDGYRSFYYCILYFLSTWTLWDWFQIVLKVLFYKSCSSKHHRDYLYFF